MPKHLNGKDFMQSQDDYATIQDEKDGFVKVD